MTCDINAYYFSIGFGLFFFFQAEDGIRDYKVTGVQTCALPICPRAPHGSPGAGAVRPQRGGVPRGPCQRGGFCGGARPAPCEAGVGGGGGRRAQRDRKSTRLNSSHLVISYAVFCLKKKKNLENEKPAQQYVSKHPV